MKVYQKQEKIGQAITIDTDDGEPTLQLMSFYKADEEHDRFVDAVDALEIANWMCMALESYKKSEWVTDGTQPGWCKRCNSYDYEGHKPDCQFLKVKKAFGPLW